MGLHVRTDEAVLTSTHNLCFGAKIRKIGIPLHTSVLVSKSGVQGVYFTRTCFRHVGASFIYRINSQFQNHLRMIIQCSETHNTNITFLGSSTDQH